MSRGDDRGGRAPGLALVPSAAAAASPAGRVTREIYDHVKDWITADLARGARGRGCCSIFTGRWSRRASMTARAT